MSQLLGQIKQNLNLSTGGSLTKLRNLSDTNKHLLLIQTVGNLSFTFVLRSSFRGEDATTL